METLTNEQIKQRFNELKKILTSTTDERLGHYIANGMFLSNLQKTEENNVMTLSDSCEIVSKVLGIKIDWRIK